jgi:hypothetical protein
MDELDKNKDMDKNKEIQEQDTGKENDIFLWKFFYRFYGHEDGVKITMIVNTWIDLPHEYGSLDLHFVELCTDSSILYKAGTSSSISLNVYGESSFPICS